jgi:hypothetical protein
MKHLICEGSVHPVSEPPPPRIEFESHADPALEAGAYANGLAIWHTVHEFTFDFFVSSGPPQEASTPGGERVIRAPHRLVARIRVPPTSVFDIIRTINQNLTLYEQKFGQIRMPGQDAPLYPPEEGAQGEPGPPADPDGPEDPSGNGS